MKTPFFLLPVVPFSLVLALGVSAAEQEAVVVTDVSTASAQLSESLRREATAAIDRGARWLIRHQAESGAWSNPEFPALTALPVWALTGAGRAQSAAVSNGVNYILSCVHPDGSIFVEPSETRKGGGLSNYNTAISMVALHRVNRPDLGETIQSARRYIAGTQHTGNDEYRGGMGYDAETGRPYADLSNSYISYEAMRLTEDLKDLQGETAATSDLNWEAAASFVSSLTNHDGGFIYKPEHSMAGAETNETGEVRFRSYGSMTYAGLLSLIYADVDRDDPRIVSAIDWAAKNWTLEENPGMGQEGLFYFYNVLTKALAANGQDQIPAANGATIHWRTEIVKRLLNLQKIDPDHGDGFWVNEAGRWFEADPVLVTSYAMIALDIALGDTAE